MNTIILIKHFLNKDTYNTYRHLIDGNWVQGDTSELLSILDDFYVSHETSPTLNDLYFLAITKLPKERCDLLFQNLQSLEPSESVEIFLEDLRRKYLYEQLSLVSYEAANGRNVTHKMAEILGQLETKIDNKEHFATEDLSTILNDTVKEPGLRWRLNTLNRMLGSLRGGDIGIVTARPEAGKTGFLASEITYMVEHLPQEAGPAIWFNNEEQKKKVKLRTYQAALGLTVETLLSDPVKYEKLYNQITHGKLLIYDGIFSKREVENLCKQLKPSLICFDQLDKVQGFTSDREDLRLGAIYQWARELAKTYNCPIIGVTQASGEAEDVQWLHMGHIANSKTSKQAEADWILGIGKLNDPSYSKVRYFSIMKNKLMGDMDTEPSLRHGRMEVLFEPSIMRYVDIS